MVQFGKRSELSFGRKSQSSIVSFSYTALAMMYFEESIELFGSRRDPLNSLDRLCASICNPNLQVSLGDRQQQSVGHVSTVGQIIPATMSRPEDEGDRSTRAKARFYRFRLKGPNLWRELRRDHVVSLNASIVKGSRRGRRKTS